MTPPIPCSAQVLTRNSAATIRRCLESLRDLEEVIVVDGNSTDDTVAIAKSFLNVRIVEQDRAHLDADGRITDFAAIRNGGMQSATLPWILVIDADERASPGLLQEITTIIAVGKPGMFDVPRLFSLNEETIDVAAVYPSVQTRFFHRSCITGYTKAVHERPEPLADVRPQPLHAAIDVPLPPALSLLPKYQRYLRMEQKRLGVIPWGRWCKWVLWRNLKTSAGLTARMLWLRVSPAQGKRLPLLYELQFIGNAILTIAYTFPPVVWYRQAALPPIVRQVAAYCCAGGFAAAVDLGLFYLLFGLGVWYIAASITSGIAAFLTAFVLHKHVVFAAKGSTGTQFARFCMMGVGNIIATTALLYAGVAWAGIPEVIAKPMCTVIIATVNFAGYKWFVYAR